MGLYLNNHRASAGSYITMALLNAIFLRMDGMNYATSDLNMNSNRIINMSRPMGLNDAATKAYVDGNNPLRDIVYFSVMEPLPEVGKDLSWNNTIVSDNFSLYFSKGEKDGQYLIKNTDYAYILQTECNMMYQGRHLMYTETRTTGEFRLPFSPGYMTTDFKVTVFVVKKCKNVPVNEL